MAEVKFSYGTKANYDALSPKDMDTLYFTTDTLQLFKGTNEYTKSSKMVSSLPTSGQIQGVIYFRMTDYTMHIWNGTEFIKLNRPNVTKIPDSGATNDDVPTTKAVADYVDAKISEVEDIKGKFVTDVTYRDGVISVAKGDAPVATICRLVYRSNADSSNVSLSAEWLVRKGLSADSVQVAIKADKTNGAYCDAFYKSSGTYMSVVIRSLASGGRGSQGRTWTLIGSGEAAGTTATSKGNSSECWKTIAEAGTALHNQAYSSIGSAVDSGYVNSAGTSTKAESVIDYGDTNRTIKIGYSGSGLTTANLTHIAGYTNNGTQIKDVNKDVLKSWIGLKAAAYKDIKSLSAVGTAGWTNQSSGDALVPTMAFMAFWNGCYSGTASNLQYCDRGRFGTIITKGSGDYLPIGGGTLTGDLKFPDIGNTNTSNKITWNGSTDGADIYYQTTASDQGNLVLNLRDDSNCYLRIAKNGTFKSYFTPDDGNFHGNVTGNVSGSSGSCTGNSATATTAAKLGRSGNTGVPMTFYWSGQSGQPSWLWGGNDGTNMYVYNPSNFNVNNAKTANALNATVRLTGGDNNTTGYRLIGQVSIGQWSNYRCVMLINSRHQGAGLVSVTIGNNTSSITQANAYAEIKYWGPTGSGSIISSSTYQVYISADGKTGYLFWQFNDYSPTSVYVISSDFTISNGTWTTGIGSGYGARKAATEINAASTAVTASNVKDSGNSNSTTFAYSKSGMNYGDYTWLAAWNGYELRAVNKSQLATAGHNHNIESLTNFSSRVYDATVSRSANTVLAAPNGSNGKATFRKLVAADLPAAYLPLTGGTMTGQIKRAVGSSWIADRDNAALYGTSSGSNGGYHPIVGQKTPSGAWTIGTYSDERLIFDYTTDTNKNAGKNEATQVYLPAQAGTIITSATIGNQTVATAGKLSSSAGSATQPVYFKDGKPAACTYSLNKTVPSDAKFTDTNTWRGIQNNLTSTSTTDSLSAAMGKKLQDEKAPASGSNNYVRVYNSANVGNSSSVTFNDLAKQHCAVAMINSATDNPLGKANWVHALSMAWANNVNTAWVSQLGIGVNNGTGMWYRTTSGSIAGRGWTRVYDDSYHPNGVTASGSGYIRFDCGIQICWDEIDYRNNEASGVAIFPAAFKNTYISIAISPYGTQVDYNITISSQTASYFQWKKNGTKIKILNYIAIGYWK